MVLSAADILAAEDFEYAEVDCPEFGGKVRVRALTAAQQSQISKRVQAKQTEDLEVLLCLMGCVDEEGTPIFAKGDLEGLRKKNTAVISRIAKRILELSSGEPEAVKKNSAETANGVLF